MLSAYIIIYNIISVVSCRVAYRRKMIKTLDDDERHKNAEIKDFTIDETRIYFTGHKNALSNFFRVYPIARVFKCLNYTYYTDTHNRCSLTVARCAAALARVYGVYLYYIIMYIESSSFPPSLADRLEFFLFFKADSKLNDDPTEFIAFNNNKNKEKIGRYLLYLVYIILI